MTTVESFLADYTPPVQEIALKLREIVLEMMPDAVEQVDVPGKLLGYGTSATYAGTVFVIMPLKDSVNLGFARGAHLDDPDKLLRGTGKNARHIKFTSIEKIDTPALRQLLQTALDAHKAL